MSETIQQPTPELIHFEYQHTDEQGNPLLDPRTGKQIITNLSGKDWKEIAEKERDAHINVTRALHRVRSHKPVPAEPIPAPKQLSPEEERQAAADLQDPTKARAAVRKLTGVDDIEAEMKKAREAQDNAKALAAQHKFMSAHLTDYYPCKANSDVMWNYVKDNELDPREVDNYEIAFNAVGHLLAQRPAAAAPTPPPNEPPPVAEPPRQASGVQPGSMSGTRPKARPKNEISKESITEMRKTPQGREEFKRRMRDPAFVAAVNALGIRPSGNFF